MRQTCTAAVFTGSGRPFELRSFPVPDPGPGEAIVRIECCTICGSDLHTVTGARTEPVPSILGHEIVGTIAAVGDPPPRGVDGQPLEPGERITWSTSVSCGACDRCRRGLPQKCRTLAKYGHELAVGPYALSGGLAEYLVLRRGSAAIPIARSIPVERICPVNCATATVAAAFRTGGPVAGQNVLIFGAGMLGVTAAAFARSLDAHSVTICDVNGKRLERAAKFGANCAVEWHPEKQDLRERLTDAGAQESLSLIVELSGSAAAVEAAIHIADIGTRIVLVGSVMKSRPVSIDPEQIVRRWISIQGVHNYTPADLRAAVSFISERGDAYPFAELVEYKYPLSEVNTAIVRAIDERPFRVAVGEW